MSSDCENAENCMTCNGRYGRCRCMRLHTLDRISDQGVKFRFYVEGGGTQLHTLTWGGAPNHCPGVAVPPVEANTTFSTYLSEQYMKSENLVWSTKDTKHPLAFAPDSETYLKTAYVPAQLVIDRLMFQLIIEPDAKVTPPVIHVPADPKYLTRFPEIRFGARGPLQLTDEGFNKFVEPHYKGQDLNAIRARKTCLLDARVSFTLMEGHRPVEDDRSLFDGTRFLLDRDQAPPSLGTATTFRLHRDYHLQLNSFVPLRQRRPSLRPSSSKVVLESMGGAPAVADAGDQRREGVSLILRGLRMLAGDLLKDEDDDDDDR